VENNLQDKALWRDSDYAAHYFAREVPYLKTGLRQAIGPSVLQIGSSVEQMVIDELDLPYLVRTEIAEGEGIALRADPAFLPFAPDSFATVILPHVLEGHPLPHQVLREAHRVLMSDGHIVVTGFNPLSITRRDVSLTGCNCLGLKLLQVRCFSTARCLEAREYCECSVLLNPSVIVGCRCWAVDI